MTWVKRAPRPHHCSAPILWPWVHVDSVWRCDVCQTEWFVQGYAGQKYWRRA